MTLKERVKKAVDEHNALELGRCVDFMRFKGGLNYGGCYDLVNKIAPISKPAFESMMYEADQEVP